MVGRRVERDALRCLWMEGMLPARGGVGLVDGLMDEVHFEGSGGFWEGGRGGLAGYPGGIWGLFDIGYLSWSHAEDLLV